MRHCGQLASFLLAAPSWQAGVPPPWAPEPRHCGAQSTSRLASGTHHRTQIRFVDASGARRDGQGTVSPSLRQITEKGCPKAALFSYLAGDAKCAARASPQTLLRNVRAPPLAGLSPPLSGQPLNRGACCSRSINGFPPCGDA